MTRVFLSYAGEDSDAAIFIANQLRANGCDVFIDYQRMMNPIGFSSRLRKEIISRGRLVLIQSAEALRSPLVQSEIEFAYENDLQIVPIALGKLNVRETGEFRFLLHLKPVELYNWKSRDAVESAIQTVLQRLQNAGNSQMITVDSAQILSQAASIPSGNGWVRSMAFSSDSKLLAVSSNTGSISLWDVRGLQPLHITTFVAHEGMVWGVAFPQRHPFMVSCGGDGTVRFWDMNTFPNVYEFSKINADSQTVYALAVASNGRYMAAANHQNCAIIYDLLDIDKTGTVSAVNRFLHAGQVYSVAFSPDGYLLASTSRDAAVRLWEVDYSPENDGKLQRSMNLMSHTSWVNSAAFAPHGLLLATASNDGTVRLWDVHQREVVDVLEGHHQPVHRAVFSPDGSILASGGRDQMVRLWDVVSGGQLAVLGGHQGSVNTLAFSPDGTLLATGSGDMTVKLWRVNHEALV